MAINLYYESATKGKAHIGEFATIQMAESIGEACLNHIKILRKSDMTKSVICVRCYEEENIVFQYGSI